MTNSTTSKGAVLAEQLSDFLNGASNQDKKDFVIQMMKEHRFLQQEVFNLMVDTMEGWAKLENTKLYDARNKYAVDTSAKIVKMLK